jgi:purine nucleosidase
MAEHKHKVIIDTDIADDIDDANALAFALGSPELDILGVTVVYGDVETRAKVARKLIRAWGRDIPVHMGYERPMEYDWFPGTVPEVPSQKRAVLDEPPLENPYRSAADFIIQAVRASPGEVTVITLGACTNVGAALCADPELSGLVKEIRSLLGHTRPTWAPTAASGRWEPSPGLDWNVAYDPLAAHCIARSGAPWVSIGGDTMGVRNGLQRAEFDALEAHGSPASRTLLELIVLMRRWKGAGDPSIHTIKDCQSASVCDVMAPASLLIGEQMDIKPGWLVVNTRCGCVDFRPDPLGPHRAATKRLGEGVYRGEILRRLLNSPK